MSEDHVKDQMDAVVRHLVVRELEKRYHAHGRAMLWAWSAGACFMAALWAYPDWKLVALAAVIWIIAAKLAIEAGLRAFPTDDRPWEGDGANDRL